jgi:hypothetical protein
MSDPVYEAFLRRQTQDALALAADSDVLDLTVLEGTPPNRFIAEFRCRGMVRIGNVVREADRFLVGIRIPLDYLAVFDPMQVLTILAPAGVYHPNIGGPWVCPGHLQPGIPLVSLLHIVYEIITFHRVTMNEREALTPDACAWARANRGAFPTDRRPLRRRRLRSPVDRGETSGQSVDAVS